MLDRQFQNKVQFPDSGAVVIVLIDEDFERDCRVLASIKEYADVQVIDCRTLQAGNGGVPLRIYVKALKALLVALVNGFSLWHLLRCRYGLTHDSFENGIRSSWNSFLRAHRVVDELRLQIKGVGLIHAHDLYCGAIGAELAYSNGARLIYDAHEVEFHRNRKNSWLRLAFDWVIEKRVIESAHEVRVVSAPIAELYRSVYRGADDRLRVVPNDHFLFHALQTKNIPVSGSATIIYVGGGTKGRQLEKLALVAADSRILVHAFFIGEIPAFALEAGWVIGEKYYEDELVALTTLQRCMMWCCVEHVCLSYRLSLPNKFFQSLAVGMPVIVSAGGYLEQLVYRYEIGAVFDGNNFKKIVEQIESDQYQLWVERIKALREGLRKGCVSL